MLFHTIYICQSINNPAPFFDVVCFDNFIDQRISGGSLMRVISLNWVIGSQTRSYLYTPMPLRRGLSPSGRFPPSFIRPVIIITGLNKLYSCMFSP